MFSSIRAFFCRLLNVVRRNKSDGILDSELEFHLEMEIQENLRRGMNPEEARRRAHIALGGMDQTREAYRETGSISWIEALIRDARYGIRMFRKNPGFSLAAIITLALCIGANTAIYSMLDALIFKPLPFPEADRIVSVYNIFDQDDAKQVGNAKPDDQQTRHQPNIRSPVFPGACVHVVLLLIAARPDAGCRGSGFIRVILAVLAYGCQIARLPPALSRKRLK